MSLKVQVLVFAYNANINVDAPKVAYQMDHDDPTQRRVLGAQCRAAFEAGQTVLTHPIQMSPSPATQPG